MCRSPAGCGNRSPGKRGGGLVQGPLAPLPRGVSGSEQDGGSSSSRHGASPPTPCLTLLLPDQDPGSDCDVRWDPLAGGSLRGKGGRTLSGVKAQASPSLVTRTSQNDGPQLSCHRRALWPHRPFFRPWISDQCLKSRDFL